MPSSRPRAITHDDLAPKPRGLDLASKAGALLTIACILCGLFCFILSLFAEATRTEVTWVLEGPNNKGHRWKGHDHNHSLNNEQLYECMYSGSGKMPLTCASIAFVALAIVMLVQHSFMLVAISKIDAPAFISWDPQSSTPIKSLTCQAAFFFVSTWICFAIGEIMLLIGLSVESGHLKDWATPRPNCLIIRQGVFTAAGVFSLLSVFLAAGLYATALRAQWACQEQDNVRREVLESSTLYTSPPRSPHRTTVHNLFSDVVRQNPTFERSPIDQYQANLSQKGTSIV